MSGSTTAEGTAAEGMAVEGRAAEGSSAGGTTAAEGTTAKGSSGAVLVQVGWRVTKVASVLAGLSNNRSLRSLLSVLFKSPLSCT